MASRDGRTSWLRWRRPSERVAPLDYVAVAAAAFVVHGGRPALVYAPLISVVVVVGGGGEVRMLVCVCVAHDEATGTGIVKGGRGRIGSDSDSGCTRSQNNFKYMVGYLGLGLCTVPAAWRSAKGCVRR